MAAPALETAPIGPGIAFIVPVGDSSAESSPQASPAAAPLLAAATPSALTVVDAIPPEDMTSDKLKNEVTAGVQGPGRASAPLIRRAAPQHKQRAGTFVQAWTFRCGSLCR